MKIGGRNVWSTRRLVALAAMLPRLAGADQTGAGWWADGGFVSIRLPDQPAPITVMLRT